MAPLKCVVVTTSHSQSSPPQTSPHNNLTRFSLFTSLPPELRLKIYAMMLFPNPKKPRILKISYTLSHARFVSNTAPPILLAISAESRAFALSYYAYLSLGPSILIPPGFIHSRPRRLPLPVPICYARDTLYISGLSPIFPSQISNTLYHLSTASSRHLVAALAVDLRVWNELCEHGFLGCLARMRALRQLLLVLEFGRSFRGELDFLEVPEWRSDLAWSAKRAAMELSIERDRARGVVPWKKGGGEGGDEMKRVEEEVSVRCVILTKGGEHA